MILYPRQKSVWIPFLLCQMLERSAGRPSAQAPAQQGGRKRRAPAISGGRPMTRRPGRRLTSSAGIRVDDSLLSPPRLSMTIWLRRKNKDTGLICQFGLEGRIKKRRVFGNGPTVLFSQTTYSQHGQLLNQTTLEEISTAWSSGTKNGMTMCAKRKTTLSAQRGCVLQVLLWSVILIKPTVRWVLSLFSVEGGDTVSCIIKPAPDGNCWRLCGPGCKENEGQCPGNWTEC